MKRIMYVLLLQQLFFLPVLALAGGAWTPDPGKGDIFFGYSKKTAHTSWNAFGDAFDNLTGPADNRVDHHHDFRYGYLSGELGLVKNLSATFLITYLDGREGPLDDLEQNKGLSDAWFGLKYQFRRGNWPMAVGTIVRTPIFYDLDGPYERHLYDDEGNFVANNPEWRGVLKHDFTFAYYLSHSFASHKAWANLDAGYTFRTGAPADHLPINAELGYLLPVSFLPIRAKANLNFVRSLGNDSERKPDDRFGSRADFNFNDASMLRASASLILEITNRIHAEAGYGQWFWGRSARQYKEPFFSLGYAF